MYRPLDPVRDLGGFLCEMSLVAVSILVQVNECFAGPVGQPAEVPAREGGGEHGIGTHYGRSVIWRFRRTRRSERDVS